MEKSFNFDRLLKDHEKNHKIKPAEFITMAGGVEKRFQTNLKYRKSSRLTVFDSVRNLSPCKSPATVPDRKSKAEHRRQQLEKWKVEKEMRKKEAASQKKKPFVAGVPHALMKFEPPHPPKAMPSTSGRVPRSQTAKQNVAKQEIYSKPTIPQSFAPENASFRPPQNLTKALTIPPMTKSKRDKIKYIFNPILPDSEKRNKSTRSKPQVTTKASRLQPLAKVTTITITSSFSSEVTTSSSLETESSTDKLPILEIKTPRRSMLRDAKQFTPKNPVPESESSSEERLRSPKSPVEVPMTPEQIAEDVKKISPFVTMSRGKDNARKEMKKKSKGQLDDDPRNMDSIVYIRQQLQSEIKRLTEMCEVWDKIQEQTVLSDSILELVQGAVDQAQLLMSLQMQHFAALVERCAWPQPRHPLVTPADLQGSWDMVFMQVEHIVMRFKELEELRARGWVEDAPVVMEKKAAPNKKKKEPVRAAGGPSKLKELIAAARKAKKERELIKAENKAFDAGFFCVRTPPRTPLGTPLCTPLGTPLRTPLGTTDRHSLLKAVLSSEAKNSPSQNAASFAMLRASIMSQNVEIDGIGLLPFTPTTLTPTSARSILKSTKGASEKKSIEVIPFHEADNSMSGVQKSPELTDSGMSAMDVDKETKQKEYKENNRSRRKLARQDAITEDN